MERKIGEIFEIGGEWYQCVKGIGCFQCVFNRTLCVRSNISRDIIGNCSKNTREDGYAVIFKKLEKVGKPYFDNEYNIWIQAYRPYITVTDIDILPTFISTKGDGLIHLEIKQNDMEQEIEYFGDENNNAKHSNSESIGKNLKEFDLKAAKQGKPVCTRDGRKARIICFDYKGDSNAYPILALISTINLSGVPSEIIAKYTEDGRYAKYNNVENNEDLMMFPEKKEGWVNVYKGIDGVTFSKHPYTSKDEAIKKSGILSNRIDTIKVSWEE